MYMYLKSYWPLQLHAALVLSADWAARVAGRNGSWASDNVRRQTNEIRSAELEARVRRQWHCAAARCL